MNTIVDRFDDFLTINFGLTRPVIDKYVHPKVTLGYNTCYVVAAIVIVKNNILMQREAKKSCYGKWYLPAGRMEANETMKDAVKREAKEETGMDIDPMSLLFVESYHKSWFRFTFAAHCIGGTLKNIEDKESVEAKWIAISDVYEGNIDLRHTDIVRLIQQAEVWYATSFNLEIHYLLPAERSHMFSFVRVYLVSSQQQGLYVFIGNKDRLFVEMILNQQDVKSTAVAALLICSLLQKNGFNGELIFHGAIRIEHSGIDNGENDGVFISLLVEPKDIIDLQRSAESWKLVTNPNIETNIRRIINEKLSTKLLM